MRQDKLPLSALVVSYNEGDILARCLASIQFCDEITVYDLGSSDDSVEVARAAGALVRKHKRVPHAELLYIEELPKLRNDWVLLTDPDEEVSPELRKELFKKFDKLSTTVATVRVPMQYYFKSHELKGTIWGGIRFHRFLIHRKRAYFRPLVNTPVSIKEGFETEVWPYSGGIIHHYWVRGYREFFSKHKRYITKEGKAGYERGERTSYRDIIRSPWRSFYRCLIMEKGYRDGLIGIFLSLFWAWYNTSVLFKLKREQIKRGP
jgi:glycosyltransferase involved in cell wall biosynthesis